MRLMFNIFLRVIWLMVVYVIAVYCAAATATFGVGSVWTAYLENNVDAVVTLVDAALLIGITGAFFGHAFFVPGLIGISASEVFRIRNALAHLLGGVGAAIYAGKFTPIVNQTHVSQERAWELLLAAGVVAGGVYWLLAGRNAGRWKDEEIAARKAAEKRADPSSQTK